MANTSATGGYLVPGPSPAPLQGQSFEDFIQEVFTGVSGFDAELVRPRFQLEGVNLPPSGITWMAMGVTNYQPDTFAVTDGPELSGYVEFDYWDKGYAYLDPDSASVVSFQRNEVVTILCSFYGPECSMRMAMLRDGLQINQNREVMTMNAMTLVEANEGIRVPSLVKEKWLDRVDLSVRIRRLILRSYPILSLLSAQLSIDNGIEDVSINVVKE